MGVELPEGVTREEMLRVVESQFRALQAHVAKSRKPLSATS